MSYCKWVVRPGTCNTFWAQTPCKHGYIPLTKINRLSEIEDSYNNRLCPICGRTILIDLGLFKNDICIKEERMVSGHE